MRVYIHLIQNWSHVSVQTLVRLKLVIFYSKRFVDEKKLNQHVAQKVGDLFWQEVNFAQKLKVIMCPSKEKDLMS